MDEYIVIKLDAEDRYGSSGISFEGLGFEEAKGKVLEFIEYLYRMEHFANVKIEITIGRSVSKRTFEKVRYLDAVEKISDFLAYAYKEEKGEERPYELPVPEWIDETGIQDLSQSEKVLLLLKNEHQKGWVRSQDLQEEYERMFGERIKLSSLSTYLARFHAQELLERRGSRAQREYRVIKSPALAKV